MKIIGRKTEKKELEQCEKSKKSELVCVYGRRRAGKTYLIEQTFGDYFAFRAIGLEKGSTKDQLKSFNERLKECGDDIKTIPKNWFEAFSRLDKILSRDTVTLSPHNKKIIFFDEFPWFATQRSDFLLAFEDFWNRRGTQSGDIVFIICGSATSWIIKNVLDNSGSLYKRVTAQIFITPFNLAETELYFKDNEFGWSREQILEFQMVFGGLPFFMSLMNGDESFMQNVNRLLFRPNALLQAETKKLLESTLSESPVYGQILEELSTHLYGMKKSECQEKLGIPTGTFSRAVEDLLKCRYVIEYTRNYEKNNPKYLQLVDPYLLFHYHFLSKNKKISNYEKLTDDTGRFSNWRGHAFELLCFLHTDQLKKALGISGVNADCFPWCNPEDKNGVQIDMIIERDDRITNLCEMKCTDQPFVMTKEDDISLLRKRDTFKEKTGTKNTIKIVLVSAAGLSGVKHTEHISAVITLDDLFEN